ncbi:MAG: mono/diheme cytochrome c family protein [Myxococcota bacterium]|jgi:mono/diheme cytochrome c family protein
MRMVMAIAMAGLLTACGGGKDEDSGGAGGGGDVGADVYADNCASCHAADGSGGVGVALNSGVVAGLSDDDLKSIVTSGIAPTMPAFSLTESDLDALVGFLRSEFGG